MIMTAFVLSACFGIEGLLEIWRIHRIDSKRYVDIVKSRGGEVVYSIIVAIIQRRVSDFPDDEYSEQQPFSYRFC